MTSNGRNVTLVETEMKKNYSAHHKNLNKDKIDIISGKMQAGDSSSRNIKYLQIFAGVPRERRQY